MAAPLTETWSGHVGSQLPRDPNRNHLQRAVDPTPKYEKFYFRPEARMVGNTHGLDVFDRVTEQHKAREKEHESRWQKLEEDLFAMKMKTQLPELCKYNTKIYINTQERNRTIHGGDVLFDLQVARCTTLNSFNYYIPQKDIAEAFFNRYGYSPDIFPENLPVVIASIIGLQSNLKNLHIWSHLTFPKFDKIITKRDCLRNNCCKAIERWLGQNPPYSQEEAAQALNSFRVTYDSLLTELSQASQKKASGWKHLKNKSCNVFEGGKK